MEMEQEEFKLAWTNFINVLINELKIKEMLNFLIKVLNKCKRRKL